MFYLKKSNGFNDKHWAIIVRERNKPYLIRVFRTYRQARNQLQLDRQNHAVWCGDKFGTDTPAWDQWMKK